MILQSLNLMEDIKMDKITLKSKRFNKDYYADLFIRDGILIIRHTSLDRIYWELPDTERPKFKIEPFDISKMPGIPPMFAVKCIMDAENFHIEMIGELLCQAWEVSNSVTRDFPLTTCHNRAFDRAFLRFMKFDIEPYKVAGIYSSEEIAIDNNTVSLMDKNVSQAIRNDTAASCGNITGIGNSDAIPVPNYDRSKENTIISASECNNYTADNGTIPHVSEPCMYDQFELPLDQQNHMRDDQNTFNGYYNISDQNNANWFATPQGMNMAPDMYSAPNTDSGVPDYLSSYPDGLDFSGSPLCDQAPAFPDPTIEGPNSPFPYMNSSNNSLSIPDDAPANILTIRRISYDAIYNKSCIETNIGIFYYDPIHNMWESSSTDANTVAVDWLELYNKCSDFLKMELKDYKGLI